MKSLPIREQITEDGQPYQDDPIYVNPKPERTSRIAMAIANAFKLRVPERLTVGHERITLRWMKPGPDGTLIPK